MAVLARRDLEARDDEWARDGAGMKNSTCSHTLQNPFWKNF
jgi:hypothetical protein